MILDGNKATLSTPGAAPQVFDLDKDATMRAIFDQLLVWLGPGSLAAARDDYELATAGTAAAPLLTLTPKLASPIGKAFTRIELRLDAQDAGSCGRSSSSRRTATRRRSTSPSCSATRGSPPTPSSSRRQHVLAPGVHLYWGQLPRSKTHEGSHWADCHRKSVVLGCAHSPTQPGARADLIHDAQKTVADMERVDPTLTPLIANAAGYIVFPRVGEGGFIVGGGSGAGVLFENGLPVHFAELRLVSAGALAGGQRYAQIVVVKDPDALQAMKAGRYDFGASASAVIVRAGAASGASFDKGTAVFIQAKKGAMVNASLNSQRIRLTL